MKKLLIFIVLLSSLASMAQERKYTYIAQRNEWLAGAFRALGLPAGDGPAAFQSGQRPWAGAVYYDSAGVDAGLYIYDGSTWTTVGGSSLIAGQGIAISGDSVHLGGTISLPAYLQAERVVSTNRKIMHWTNGVLPTSGGPSFLPTFPTNINWSPYQFISSDTVTSTGQTDAAPSADVPFAGMYASRQLYFADGVIRTQKVFGHNFQMQWNWKDTFSLDTRGGDYNVPFKVESMYLPRGTGRQGVRASHGTGQNNSRYYAAPALLVNTLFNNSAGNYIKVNGHLSGVNSYLVMGNVNPDTLGRFIYYTTGGFISATSQVGISYDFAPASYFDSPRIDSAYGWFDTARVKRWYHANKTVIGPSVGTSNPWSSSDQLKVLGNVNITDSLNVGGMLNWNDSTNIDVVLSPRTAGGHALRKIRFDQLGTLLGAGGITSFGSPGAGDANGGTVSGSVATLHYATGTTPGMVSTTTQSITGNKTFNDIVTIGDELRAQLGIRIRDAASGFYRYLYNNTLTSTKHLYFADDDADGDTIATRAFARTLAVGGGGVVASGTPSNHQWAGWTNSTTIKGFTQTASKIVVTDANGDPSTSTAAASKADYLANVTSDIQSQFDENGSIRKWWWTSSSSTNIITVGTNAATTSGTVSNPTTANTNILTATRRFTLTTAASAGATARTNSTSTEVWRGDASNQGGFKAIFRFGLSTTGSGNRCFVGFANTVSALTNVDFFTNTSLDRVGMYIDANSGNWNIIHNTTGSTATTVALGANFPVNTTDLLELRLSCDPNGSTISYIVKNLSTGNSTSGTLSTNLPTAANFLGAHTWINTNAGTAAVAMDVAKVYVETRY